MVYAAHFEPGQFIKKAGIDYEKQLVAYLNKSGELNRVSDRNENVNRALLKASDQGISKI
jgi:hypothetical protein